MDPAHVTVITTRTTSPHPSLVLTKDLLQDLVDRYLAAIANEDLLFAQLYGTRGTTRHHALLALTNTDPPKVRAQGRERIRDEHLVRLGAAQSIPPSGSTFKISALAHFVDYFQANDLVLLFLTEDSSRVRLLCYSFPHHGGPRSHPVRLTTKQGGAR